MLGRWKTYAARSGYVYEYCYQGQSTRSDNTEFVFEVSADRRTSSAVSVLLPHEVAAGWERDRAFDLRGNERYAIVKTALFQAFDERPAPADMRAPVLIRRADLDGIVETLGIL
ncbi:MAG: hypothetical protein HY822_21055 [Acidobacteria bacterium]|nr:hypothetical protein [Acidobacteriota bacterium]